MYIARHLFWLRKKDQPERQDRVMWRFAICRALNWRNRKCTHSHMRVLSITSLEPASLSGIIKLRLLGFKLCTSIWSGLKSGLNIIWEGTRDMIRLQKELCSRRFLTENLSKKASIHPSILCIHSLRVHTWGLRVPGKRKPWMDWQPVARLNHKLRGLLWPSV